MRRSSLFLLVSVCATAFVLASSYLGESRTTGSATRSGVFEAQVERMVVARQEISASLQERYRELAGAAGRIKDELEDLIP